MLLIIIIRIHIFFIQLQVQDIPNQHRAGLYALLKLLVMDIIPKSVQKVCYL